jgi:hypothetical protein
VSANDTKASESRKKERRSWRSQLSDGRHTVNASRALRVYIAAGIILATSRPTGSAGTAVAPDIVSDGGITEAAAILGDGVVGDAQSVDHLGDPATVARWGAGAWRYRITSGPRQGQTEYEAVAPIGAMPRGETWERRVGRDYTLYLSQTDEGGIVMPTELAHEHSALVRFEPPLIYLVARLAPGDKHVFDGKMDVYNARRPTTRWYSGRIQATTTHAGVYRVTTPAGAYNATLIRTDYRIEILRVVSVSDTLYTFYAADVGKLAEAERRRISAVGLVNTETKIGKVLVSFTPPVVPPTIQAP